MKSANIAAWDKAIEEGTLRSTPLRFLGKEYRARQVVKTGLWEVYDTKLKSIITQGIVERNMAEQECDLLNGKDF